ncbi:MAG: ribokinase [Anaerolineales bacterium]|nr:ribokinase [Anaerolineales bacterium]
MKLLVIGSLNMDLVAYTDRLPEAGESVLGKDFQTFPGGKGANQAVAAARLGAEVSMLGCVGNDAFGTSLIQNLADNGVKTEHILRESETPTGTAVITVDAQGQNTLVVIPGSNYRLLPADIEAQRQLIEEADILLLQLEIPLTSVQRAVEIAGDAGTSVILNPAPACDLPDRILQLVDVFIPNETEAKWFSGGPLEHPDDLSAAAARLRERGVKRVLITRGKNGAFYQNDSGEWTIPAFTVTAVDATAAGDAFIGAYAASLAQGFSLQEALRWSTAAGALAVSRKGAQSSLPSKEELLQFLKKKPSFDM